MKSNQKARSFVQDDEAIIFELLIGAVFALIVGYTALNIGTYITGTVGSSLIDSMAAEGSRSPIEVITAENLNLTAQAFSDNAGMVSTAYLITIITLPLMAVLVIKKMV